MLTTMLVVAMFALRLGVPIALMLIAGSLLSRSSRGHGLAH
jgi:hypothetical protein